VGSKNALMSKLLFYDLETTGFDHNTNAIHQIAGCIEIDGEVKEWFDFKCKPFNGAKVRSEALAVSGVTFDQIMQYPEPKQVFSNLVNTIFRHTHDKLTLVGFNNLSFDDRFLHRFFSRHKTTSGITQFSFGEMFHSDSHDVKRMSKMRGKLSEIASFYGIKVDPKELHNATYDIYLTREIYKILMK